MTTIMAEEEFANVTITTEVEIATPEEEIKKCTKCDKDKPLSKFEIQKGKHISQCKDCRNARKAELKREKTAKKRAEKIAKGEIILAKEEGNKYCKYCKTEKPEDIFRKGRAKCLDCERKDGREYRRSEYGKEKARKWEKENKERMAELHAKNYQKNKAKINEKFVERYANDIVFKLKVNTKSRIHDALKRYKDKGITKNNSTLKYLGCDIKSLVKWFLFCFGDDERFTLENNGEFWHMDHVIPLATFDFGYDISHKMAFNWRNVAPLPAKDNMAKKDSIDVKQIEKHYENLVEFHEKHNLIFPQDFKNLYAKHLTMIRESP